MSILDWVLHGFLAFAFVSAGGMKLVFPKEWLHERGMSFVEDFSQTQVRMIGVLEVLGGLGVILPVMLNILPVVSGVAAAGLLLTMLGAALTHIKRSEMINITANLVLGGVAGYVAFLHLAG